MMKPIVFCLLLACPGMIPAAHADSSKIPYLDADNITEASVMMGMNIYSRPLIARRCSEKFPGLKENMDTYLVVYEVRIERLKSIVAAITGSAEIPDSRKKLVEASLLAFSALPDQQAMNFCGNAMESLAEPERVIKRNTPRLLSFLNDYEIGHPFPYFVKQGFGYKAGCTIAAINKEHPARKAKEQCACIWNEIAKNFDETEWTDIHRKLATNERATESQAAKLQKIQKTCGADHL